MITPTRLCARTFTLTHFLIRVGVKLSTPCPITARYTPTVVLHLRGTIIRIHCQRE